MKHELRLTDIGEGLEEAEIISWLVHVGDTVERDQPVVEVMTDKSNADLPAPASGTIVAVSGDQGDIVHVGQLLAIIESDASVAEPAPEVSPPAAGNAGAFSTATQDVPTAPADAASSAPATTSTPPDSTRAPRPKASPSTRRIAAERGIDLATIAGSGPGGRILLSDLDQPETTQPPAATAPPPAAPDTQVAPPAPAPQVPRDAPNPATAIIPSTPAPTTNVKGVQPLRGIRRAIAKNMAQSWSEIPHIHSVELIDAEPLLSLRARMKTTGRAEYERLTPLSFFVAAVGQALQDFPQANASIDTDADTLTYHPQVNVGVAVAAPHGLVVPVVRNVEAIDFAETCVAIDQLVQGARDDRLGGEHFRGGTATITNFGALGGELAMPLIRPPETVIVGVARQTMHVVVGADHRQLDGDVVTGFMNRICSLLTEPIALVL